MFSVVFEEAGLSGLVAASVDTADTVVVFIESDDDEVDIVLDCLGVEDDDFPSPRMPPCCVVAGICTAELGAVGLRVEETFTPDWGEADGLGLIVGPGSLDPH